MSWTIELSRRAAKEYEKLPPDRQELVGRALEEMKEDPFRGAVKPLKGKQWKGRYRKRVAGYRLIFTPFRTSRVVEISAIMLRSESTYW
ncbi:MAG: type II toxin-antitoxin system RelE/ParE family toxin [Candidatus Tectomicrobia bacterium]|nr:type II toxin-antitoxin system RelE/ParE family toxin [Candidatus Tectomicrobia bacterium]